uniref:Uncharacterized protein n=1 Tax=Glossina palpalis gambiensis TaxID=67801 RepID=A0A1B0BR92_9MUSC
MDIFNLNRRIYGVELHELSDNNTQQTRQTVDTGARKRIEEQQMIATAALLQLMSNPKKTNKRNAQMMDINGHINDLYCALATATAAAAAAAGVHSQVHTQWLLLMQYKFSALSNRKSSCYVHFVPCIRVRFSC